MKPTYPVENGTGTISSRFPRVIQAWKLSSNFAYLFRTISLRPRLADGVTLQERELRHKLNELEGNDSDHSSNLP